MKLQSIRIENYRSIEDITIQIKKIDAGYTYTLIGINESGKSSILNALYLKEGLEKVSFPRDFHDPIKPIKISFKYSMEDDEIESYKEELKAHGIPEDLINKKILRKEIILISSFEALNEPILSKSIETKIRDEIIKGYVLSEEQKIVKDNNDITSKELNLKEFVEENLIEFFFDKSHEFIFWKSEPKYLINQSIDLNEFSQNPRKLSIPLYNCFVLAGITNIKQCITLINENPSETENLKDLLGDKITQHVNSVWPDHPIKIKFNIDGLMLTFLVEDEGVRYKLKTTEQRSDGFRQFISFLLTISAQHSNRQLSNTFLVLDEPETHLHPKGQENLRDELIKITKGNSNNVAIFATHSNYMIDKKNLERCFRVLKKDNQSTKIQQLENKNTSYSEINYEVFEVPTNDYHNELYGFLESTHKTKLDNLPKGKKWKNKKSGNTDTVSIPEYIRHSIHHPENTNNKSFSQKELIKSIKMLRELKYGKK